MSNAPQIGGRRHQCEERILETPPRSNGTGALVVWGLPFGLLGRTVDSHKLTRTKTSMYTARTVLDTLT